MIEVPLIDLNDGHKIPQIGLGTWKATDRKELEQALKTAFEAGYRHIDTAQAYGNETYIGDFLRSASMKRDDLFITTKIAVQNFGHKRALNSFKISLSNLQTEYVDLLLLHFPVTGLRKKTWQAVEEILAEGKARSIGVSNYTIRHLEEMRGFAKVMPAVNQIELHVFLQQPELIKYCQQNNIIVEAYSPLARGHDFSNQTIQLIADKHHKSYQQIMLKWLLQKGLVIIPKSVTPERIRQNIDLFDFDLSEAEMNSIEALDRDMRVCWSPVHVP